MNDFEKNKPALRKNTAKKNNRLSREIDKAAEANRYAPAKTRLGPVSDIKDTTEPKNSHSNNNLLKKNRSLNQIQTNLEKLRSMDAFPKVLNEHYRSISEQFTKYPYSSLPNINSKPLNISDLEGAYTDPKVLNEHYRSISEQLIKYPYSSLPNINSKPLNISDLEGAYTELFEPVNRETLYTNLLRNQEEEIYIISGINTNNEDDAKNLFLNELEQYKREAICNDIGILTHPYYTLSKNKAIRLVNSAFTEKTFKELCDKETYKKIYWIKWSGPQCMILQKIYNPNFYTDRKFNKVVINNKSKRIRGLCTTLTQGTKDKFIFSGIINDDYDALGKLLGVEPSMFNKNKIFVKQDIQKSKKIFDNLSDTVHWLEVEENENNQQIIWRNSKGSLHSLRDYVDKKEYKNAYGENELLEAIQDRHAVIIAIDPGMGKSTTLTKLYQLKYNLNNLSRRGSCNWLINIKLQNHLEDIKNIDVNAINIADFLSAINKDLKYNIAQDLLKFTLEVAKNHKTPLLIIFDGFDKVTDASDRNKVTALLRHLRNNTYVTFWVTTSLQYQKTLEDALSTFAVTFKPLDDDEQKYFVKKYLTNRLNLVCSKDTLNISGDGKIDDSKIEEYSKAFTNKVQSTFQGDQSFIGIPFHLHVLLTGSKEEKKVEGDIVSKNCISSFKNWVRENNEPDLSYIGKNRLEIYANFINGKYETYFKKVGIIEDTQKNNFKSDANKCCEKLAKSLVHSLELDIEKKNLDMILATELVKSDQNGSAFVHPILGEYFLSEWCTNLIIKKSNTPNPTKWKLLLSILTDVNHKSVRSFINEKLVNKQLSQVALQTSGEMIKNLYNPAYNQGRNKKTFEEKTALHVAAEEGNIDIARFLLNSIHDDVSFLISFVSKLDKEGNTALHIAVIYNRFDFIYYLLESFKNDPEELKKLLEIQNNHGNTALHIAMRKNHIGFVAALLKPFNNELEKLKKIMKIQDNYGNTALHIAIKNGDIASVAALLEPFKKDSEELKKLLEMQYNHGNTILHTAAEKKNEIINPLLKTFENDRIKLRKLLEIQNNHGNTALHIAIKNRNTAFLDDSLEPFKKDSEELKKLLEIQNENGNTILHTAAENNDKIINSLVKTFENDRKTLRKLLEIQNENENTALHIAIKNRNTAFLADLLEPFKKNPEELKKLLEIQNNHGNTILHTAAENNDKIINSLVKTFENDRKTLRKLLEIKENNGYTALHIAVCRGNSDIVASLVKPFEQDLGTLKKWIKKGGGHGKTLLHIAAYKGNYNTIVYLLKPFEQHKKQLKEFIQTQNSDKRTALHIAAAKNNLVFIDSLLKFFEQHKKQLKKLISIQNNCRETALHIAVYNKKTSSDTAVCESNCDIIATLVKPFNQDLDTLKEWIKKADECGNTLVHMAANKGSYNIIADLLKPFEKNLKELDKIIKTTNNNKETALHIALQKEHYNFFASLVKPFEKNLIKYTEYLKTMGSHKETVLHIALQKADYDFINSLLKPLEQDKEQLKKVIQNQNKDKKTILHIAAEKGDEQFITSLLKLFQKDLKGLKEIIATRDNYQETALHIALRDGHDNFAISLLKPLEQHKERLKEITKIKNKDGKTAYEVRKNHKTTNEMIQLFFGKVNKEYRSSIYSNGMISPLTQSMCSLPTQDEYVYNVPSTSSSDKIYPTLPQTMEYIPTND
ncbi:ankyrin repeat domain-containing protein [Candidatus Cardinium hertigii]|uniref:ankyrin repeat domain-containing protein n=1 Tax=Candidatus Cardinium hertigii TaxID=247481 RepID=UPI003D7E7922